MPHDRSRESNITIDIGRGNHSQPFEPSRPFRYNQHTFTLDDYNNPSEFVAWQKPRHGDEDLSHAQKLRMLDRRLLELDQYEGEQARLARTLRHGIKELENKLRRNRRDRTRVVASKPVRDESRQVPANFQTIFDAESPQDATVHLELPITDDLEAELEDFCRLWRMGNFSAAQEYFEDKLMPYSNNPYVFVHFCQMLWNKGDYLAVKGLDPQAVFGEEERSLRIEWRKDNSGMGIPCLVASTALHVDDRNRSRARYQEKARESRAHARSRSRAEGGGAPVRRASGKFEHSRSVRRSGRITPGWQAIEKIAYLRFNQDDESDLSDSSHASERTVPDADTYTLPDLDELQLLRQNWRLLEILCTMHTTVVVNEDAIAEVWYTIAKFRFETGGIGSTEASIPTCPSAGCWPFDVK